MNTNTHNPIAQNANLGRRMAPAVPALVGSLVGGVGVLLGRGNLPDTLATHFALNGQPDGFAQRDVFFWLLLSIAVTAAGLAVGIAVRIGARSARAMWLWGLTYVAWLPTTIALWTIATQHGLADAQTAHGPGLFGMVWVIGFPLLIASVVARYSGGAVDERPLHTSPGLGLQHGEIAMWQRSLSVRWPKVLGALGLGATVAGAWQGAGVLIFAGVVVAIVGVVMSSLTTTVDRHGLTVAWGPLHWPVVRIGLAEIRSARADRINPGSWGGWGYRGSLKLFRKAAAVLRLGEGIAVDLTGGRTFAVTVDDAETGSALLNDLVRRSATPGERRSPTN